jgi:arabinose-5-phosphate isomerase
MRSFYSFVGLGISLKIQMQSINVEEILSVVRKTILDESKALTNMAVQSDKRLADAIFAMHNCSGRLVFTGIGKSAIVAQKIVATLNSTGTSALFMHAADAIHGDLGMISRDDMVICMSKSGETSEVKVLIPLIKGFGNTLIGMTCQMNSTLAKSSDFLLWTPMEEEADPNNLAPTTSTTLQMAMGDAIAVCLLKIKGFTPEQFARFHPGGNLGKQLYLKVGDMIDTARRPRTYLTDPLTKVIYEIGSKRYGATVVLDDNENLQGIITDGDLRRMLESKSDISGLKAADILFSSPKTCQQSDLAIEALTKLKEHKIQQLVVLNLNRYIGIVHIQDFIQEGLF